MRSTSNTPAGLIGACVQRGDAQFTLFELTVSSYTPHTQKGTALRLVYTEALLSGCGKYSKDTFLDALTMLGSDIRVSTAQDAILFSVRARNEHLGKTLALFTEMVKHPTFSASEITRIKSHIKNNLALAKEDARGRAYATFVSTLVEKDDKRFTYDIDTLIAEVAKVSQRDVRAFHTSLTNFAWNYSCGGTAKSCATITKTLTVCKSTAKNTISEGEQLPVRTLEKRVVKLTDIPHKQNIEFSIGGPVPCTITDPEYPALFFGMAVLAIPGGFTGRLMSTVREKEGLTYTIYGQIEGMTTKEMGYWKIGTFFSPKDAVKGITSTLREVNHIIEKGITQDELKRFKAILKTRFAMVEDSLIKKVREVHGYTSAGLTEKEFQSFKDTIQNMTVAQVNATIKKYLSTQKLVISGAGPIHSVRKEIEKFAK